MIGLPCDFKTGNFPHAIDRGLHQAVKITSVVAALTLAFCFNAAAADNTLKGIHNFWSYLRSRYT